MNNPIRTLCDLYRGSGVKVRTPAGSEKRGATDVPVLARILIQADADIITYISPVVLERPEIWDEHMRRVRARLSALHWLRGIILATLLIPPLPVLMLGYAHFDGPFAVHYFVDQAMWALLTGVSFAVIRVAVLTGARLLLKRAFGV